MSKLAGQVGADLPQTSQSGEHVGLLALSSFCERTGIAHTDLQALAGLHDWATEKLCDPQCVCSGLRLVARGSPTWPTSVQLKKVKSHQSVEAFPPLSQEWLLARGSDHADAAAPQGALSHSMLSPEKSLPGSRSVRV